MEKLKNVVKNFGECFKSTRKELYFRLDEQEDLRKIVEAFHNSLPTPDEVEKMLN